MFGGKGLSLGRIFNIPVYLDWSWFLVLALAVWSLATGYFRREFTDWPAAQYWIVALITALALFGSVLLHEFGHALMARRFGIPTQSITLFIFGGVAMLGGESRSARQEFWIALIGPIVSAAVAGIAWLLWPLTGFLTPVSAVFEYLFFINLSLAGFNLIPGFPLDGGRVLRAILWWATRSMSRATVIAVQVGRLVAFGFIAFGVWRMLTGEFTNGLWLGFIGWWLKSAADSQLGAVMVRQLLADHTVRQAMSREWVAVPAETSLQSLVDSHLLAYGRRSVVVERGGDLAGLLTIHHVGQIPREQWATTTALQAMSTEDCCASVAPDTGLWDALQQMDRDGYNQLLVRQGSQMVGMLSRGDVITFLRTVQELGV
jgi:Zn-dependent protease